MKRIACSLSVVLAACTIQTTPGPSSPPPPRESRPSRPPPRDPEPDRPPPPADRPPPDRPPPDRNPRPAWDSTGWRLLGEKLVEGKSDIDQVDFSQKQGPVPTKMTIVVIDSSLEMHDLEVVFVSGHSFKPTGRHHFRENSRTRVIDLPAGEILRAIRFKYSNLPGGGRASVQVWIK
jgi:hypothetical protein